MRAPTVLPDTALLRSLLSYNKATGLLRWKRRGRQLFTSDHEWRRWNTRYAGTLALASIKGSGYRHGFIFGRPYLAHRVIWKIVTGEEPPIEIDHANGRRADNRWRNLEGATREANRKNVKLLRSNKSGVPGVYPYKGKWRAEISRRYLGQFNTKRAAITARRAAERELGYHRNHGRKAA